MTGDEDNNAVLRSERSTLFDMVGLTLLDATTRQRIDELLDGADARFGLRAATAFADDDMIFDGPIRSLVGVRTFPCPYTCVQYTNPEWLHWFDRDRWAEQLDAAVGRVAALQPGTKRLEFVWHGDWVLAVSEDVVSEIAPILEAVAATLQPPERRSAVGRDAVPRGFSETYRLADPDQRIPPSRPDIESVEVLLTSLRFGRLRWLHSEVKLRDAPAYSWLASSGISVRVAQDRMRGDDAIVGERLAAHLRPGEVETRIVRSHRDGSLVLRFDGPQRKPEHWIDDRSALVDAARALTPLLEAAAVSDVLAFARSTGVLTAGTEAGGTSDVTLKERRCPTGPWMRSLPTHSMSKFDHPDGPTGRSMLLAWATVPEAVGRSVIEATSRGVVVTEGGNASLTSPLVEQLVGLEHGQLGSRWILDGAIVLGQMWWEVDDDGKRLSGVSSRAVSTLFHELNLLLASDE